MVEKEKALQGVIVGVDVDHKEITLRFEVLPSTISLDKAVILQEVEDAE